MDQNRVGWRDSRR